MLTGDNARTAQAVARRLGIALTVLIHEASELLAVANGLRAGLATTFTSSRGA